MRRDRSGRTEAEEICEQCGKRGTYEIAANRGTLLTHLGVQAEVLGPFVDPGL